MTLEKDIGSIEGHENCHHLRSSATMAIMKAPARRAASVLSLSTSTRGKTNLRISSWDMAGNKPQACERAWETLLLTSLGRINRGVSISILKKLSDLSEKTLDCAVGYSYKQTSVPWSVWEVHHIHCSESTGSPVVAARCVTAWLSFLSISIIRRKNPLIAASNTARKSSQFRQRAWEALSVTLLSLSETDIPIVIVAHVGDLRSKRLQCLVECP
jgi:hypothetical protein